jgi:hypothetical protein
MRTHHQILLDDIDFSELPPGLKYTALNDCCAEIFIYEDDPNWRVIRKLMKARPKTLELVANVFDDQENLEAAWVRLDCTIASGYPQPSGTQLSWMRKVYDLSNYCKMCDMGKVQIAPFRILKAPTWKTYQVMTLNWVPDAFFVSPDTWEQVFQPFGIGCWPVLKPGGADIPGIVQLKFDQMLDSPLCLDGYNYSDCPECHRRRYVPIGGGFPAPQRPFPDGHAFVTQEEFGDSGITLREVLISNDLLRAIYAAKLKGFFFTPVGSNIRSRK